MLGLLLFAAFPALPLAEGASQSFMVPEELSEDVQAILRWEALPVVVSPLIAVVGYFVKSIVEARGRARRLELERVTLQIQEFYGPISAMSHRGKTAYNSMLQVYSRHTEKGKDQDLWPRLSQELKAAQGKPGAADKVAVRLWIEFVKNIAFPVNSKIVEILTDKSHLHDGPLPDDYLDLFALVAERALVISQWQQGNYSQLLFDIRFPSQFDDEIESRLVELQKRQLWLGGGPFAQAHSKKPSAARSARMEKHRLTDKSLSKSVSNLEALEAQPLTADVDSPTH